MSDCPNAEIRDRLPDLLHDRLGPVERASVVAHLEGCAECRAELELLRELHALLAVPASVPSLDADVITAGVEHQLAQPAAATRGAGAGWLGRSRWSVRSWSDWRIAAAVTLLAGGASSVLVLHRPEPANVQAVVAQVDSALPGQGGQGQGLPDRQGTENGTAPVSHDADRGDAAGAAGATAEEAAGAASGLGLSGRLADLDDQQLEALLQDIDELEAVPITEPDPVTLRIDPRAEGIGAPASGDGASGNPGQE